MTASFVQALSGSDGSGSAVTSVSTNAGSGFGAGNYIVGYVVTGLSTPTGITVTDGTNTYPVVGFLTGSSSFPSTFGIAIFAGPAATGATTITANFSPGQQFPLIEAHEVAGVFGTLDGHGISSTNNISSTTQATPSITTTTSGDYVYAFKVDLNSDTGTTTVSSPFTLENDIVGFTDVDAYAVQSTAGSISATFTVTNTGAGHDVAVGIIALSSRKTVALTSSNTSPWTLPADWPGQGDVYVIGAGGNGSARISTTRGGTGGGGGACVFALNYAMSSNPTFSIGAAGSAANTTFDSSAFVAAAGGTGTTSAAGVGGTTASSTVPTGGTKFAGGSGRLTPTSNASGGGGGGAAGPNGAGATAASNIGGAGDNGQTTAPAAGISGTAGTEWAATTGGVYGSGSGASGFASGIHAGTVGGQYGGGGSGASDGSTNAGGNGGGGLVVIVYTPAIATTVRTGWEEEQHRPHPKLWRPSQPDDFVAVPPPILNLAVTFSPFTLSATIQVPAGPAPVFGGDEEQHVPHSRRWRPSQNDDPFVLVAGAPVTAVYVFDEERGAPRFGRRRPTQNDDQTPFRQAAWVWQGDEEQRQPRSRRWHVPQNDDPFVPLPITAAVSAAIYVFDEEHGPRFRRWHIPQNDELIVPISAAPAVTTVYVFDEERGQPRRRIWRPNPNEDTLVIPTHQWIWQGDEEQHRPHSKLWHPPQNDDFVPITSPILTLNVTFSPFILNATIQLPPGVAPVFGGDEEQHAPRYRRWHLPQNDDAFVTVTTAPIVTAVRVFDEEQRRPAYRFWRGHGDEGFFLPPSPPSAPRVNLGFDQEYSQPRHRTWRIPQPEDFVPRQSPTLNLAVTFSPFTLSATIQLPAGVAPVLGWEEEQHVPRSRRWRPRQEEEIFHFVRSTTPTRVFFGWEEEQHNPRFRRWRPPQNDAGDDFNLAKFLFVGIGKNNIPPVRLTNPANAPIELWIGQTARTINQILSGKLNATTAVTLTPNATSTVIFDSRIGISSHVTLMPLSASAAATLASGQIWFVLTKGSVTINHPSSTAIDQTFGVLLIG